MFWCFGHMACGILALQPGIKPSLPALEVEVLMAGPPGKFPSMKFFSFVIMETFKHLQSTK